MLPDWFLKPETIYATALFVFSIVIATIYTVWPEGVRKVVTFPPRKVSRWLLERRTHQLAMITALHGDAYQLVLWALWNVVAVMGSIIGVSLLSGSVLLVAYLLGKRVDGWFLSGFYANTIGTILGRSWWAYEVLRFLYNYESAKTELAAEIEELRAKAMISSRSNLP